MSKNGERAPHSIGNVLRALRNEEVPFSERLQRAMAEAAKLWRQHEKRDVGGKDVAIESVGRTAVVLAALHIALQQKSEVESWQLGSFDTVLSKNLALYTEVASTSQDFQRGVPESIAILEQLARAWKKEYYVTEYYIEVKTVCSENATESLQNAVKGIILKGEPVRTEEEAQKQVEMLVQKAQSALTKLSVPKNQLQDCKVETSLKSRQVWHEPNNAGGMNHAVIDGWISRLQHWNRGWEQFPGKLAAAPQETAVAENFNYLSQKRIDSGLLSAQGFGWMVAGGTLGLYDFLMDFIKKEGFASSEKWPYPGRFGEPRLTRRTFLRGSAAGVAVVAFSQPTVEKTQSIDLQQLRQKIQEGLRTLHPNPLIVEEVLGISVFELSSVLQEMNNLKETWGDKSNQFALQELAAQVLQQVSQNTHVLREKVSAGSGTLPESVQEAAYHIRAGEVIQEVIGDVNRQVSREAAGKALIHFLKIVGLGVGAAFGTEALTKFLGLTPELLEKMSRRN